jgi:hypothetical protein
MADEALNQTVPNEADAQTGGVAAAPPPPSQAATLPPLTPEAQDLADQLTKDLSAKKDPVGVAAMNFGLYFPEFRRRVYRLSKKSAIRLLVSIMGQPLEDFSPNLKRPDEKQAFAIAQALNESKLVLILDTLYKKNLELAKATAPPTEAEIMQHEMERAQQAANTTNNNNNQTVEAPASITEGVNNNG